MLQRAGKLSIERVGQRGLAGPLAGFSLRSNVHIPRHQRGLPPPFIPIVFVPHQEVWILERFGRFHRVLSPGLQMMVPFVERVAYKHTLKVVTVEVPGQEAITKDNVKIEIDGILYYKVTDPELASYAVEDHEFAVQQLAMSTMRVELGKMALDKTFEEREAINHNIVNSINNIVHGWGLECLRYEIRDIKPPAQAMAAMELQMIAERKKRQQIIESEGVRAAEINIAEGVNQATILRAEAQRAEVRLLAEGEAESIRLRAEATAESLRRLASAIGEDHGSSAVSMQLAQKYLESFGMLAKETNTVVLPSNVADVSGMVAQATSVFSAIQKSTSNGKFPPPTLSSPTSIPAPE